MIKRVYFLKAKKDNRVGGTCHAYRTMVYLSWFAPPMTKVANEFFKEISEANKLPEDEWILEAFSRVH